MYAGEVSAVARSGICHGVALRRALPVTLLHFIGTQVPEEDAEGMDVKDGAGDADLAVRVQFCFRKGSAAAISLVLLHIVLCCAARRVL